MLLRRHIGRLLSDYYAQPSGAVVGSAAGTAASSVVDFKSFLGEWHWKLVHRRLHRRQQGQWLTPVELFRPHYSETVAEFVARTVRGEDDGGRGGGGGGHYLPDKIDVVEFGGGRGTNASIVLSHLRDVHPDVYDVVQYTVLDSSPTLHDLQREVLIPSFSDAESGNGHHTDKLMLLRTDVADIAEGRAPLPGNPETPLVAIALELLDNLPHDKVWKDSITGEAMQAEVRPARYGEEAFNGGESEGGGGVLMDSDRGRGEEYLEEIFVPLTDPLLLSIIADVPSYIGRRGSPPRWVPTAACGLMGRLLEERPLLSGMLFSDFDWLPPTNLLTVEDYEDDNEEENMSLPSSWDLRRLRKVRRRSSSTPAEGEPLVTDMDGTDHPCYLSAPPKCDVLFPTDFGRLAEFVERRLRRRQRRPWPLQQPWEEPGGGTDSPTTEEEEEPNAVVNVRAMKQSDFLAEYGHPRQVEATTGRWWTGHYNPMLHDFSNCSVLIIEGDRGEAE